MSPDLMVITVNQIDYLTGFGSCPDDFKLLVREKKDAVSAGYEIEIQEYRGGIHTLSCLTYGDDRRAEGCLEIRESDVAFQ